jgi:hypothetical protein
MADGLRGACTNGFAGAAALTFPAFSTNSRVDGEQSESRCLIGRVGEQRPLDSCEMCELMDPITGLGKNLYHGTPCTLSASATSERWQRHGTASAHIMAVRFCRLI